MPNARRRVDLKVIASTAGGVTAGLVLAVLESLVAQPALLEGVPAWLRFLLIAAAPGLIVFLSGYAAPPTDAQGRIGEHRKCECPRGLDGPGER